MQIKVPSLGESITEATVAAWIKKEGDYLEADAVVVELETDKITVEVHAPMQGILSKIVVQEGETVTIDAVLGEMTEGKAPPSPKQSASNVEQEIQDQKTMDEEMRSSERTEKIVSPAAQKISREHGIDANRIKGTGKEGRITKEDVNKYGVISPGEITNKPIKIEDIVEKPSIDDAPSDIAVCGRYIFKPTIFKFLKTTKFDKSGEIQLTDAIKALLKEEEVYARMYEGEKYDCGSKKGFVHATIALALKDKSISKDIEKIIKEII